MSTDALIQELQALGIDKPIEISNSGPPSNPGSSIPTTTAPISTLQSEIPKATPMAVSRHPPKPSSRVQKGVLFETSKRSNPSSRVQRGEVQKTKRPVQLKLKSKASARDKSKRLKYPNKMAKQKRLNQMSFHKRLLNYPISWKIIHSMFDDAMPCSEGYRACPRDLNIRGRKYWGLIQKVIEMVEEVYSVVVTRDELFGILSKEIEGRGCQYFKHKGKGADGLGRLDELMEDLKV